MTPPATTGAQTRTEIIARLNDRCRQGLDKTARIMMTRTCLGTFAEDGLSQLRAQAELRAALRDYRFTDEDGAERDRGQFEHHGTTVYFQIDYYDLDLDHGSENPADPAQTRRVLTMMLREDL